MANDVSTTYNQKITSDTAGLDQMTQAFATVSKEVDELEQALKESTASMDKLTEATVEGAKRAAAELEKASQAGQKFGDLPDSAFGAARSRLAAEAAAGAGPSRLRQFATGIPSRARAGGLIGAGIAAIGAVGTAVEGIQDIARAGGGRREMISEGIRNVPVVGGVGASVFDALAGTAEARQRREDAAKIERGREELARSQKEAAEEIRRLREVMEAAGPGLAGVQQEAILRAIQNLQNTAQTGVSAPTTATPELQKLDDFLIQQAESIAEQKRLLNFLEQLLEREQDPADIAALQAFIKANGGKSADILAVPGADAVFAGIEHQFHQR